MTFSISEYKTSIDQGNAYWMARISAEIYLKKSTTDQHPDEKKILENLKKEDLGFISVTGEDVNSAQAGLIEHEKYYCMAFRGNERIGGLD